jgi:hypothetical protein
VWLDPSVDKPGFYDVESTLPLQALPQVTLSPEYLYSSHGAVIPAASPTYLALNATLAKAFQASGAGTVFESKDLDSTDAMEWLLDDEHAQITPV